MARRVEVPFAVPREVAFDFLVDPLKRMQWQSSLRAVDDVEPMPPQAGTRWQERATGGVVSEMRLTAVDRPTMWAESGIAYGLAMNLALSFQQSREGCLVVATIDFSGQGPWRAAATGVSAVFPYAVR